MTEFICQNMACTHRDWCQRTGRDFEDCPDFISAPEKPDPICYNDRCYHCDKRFDDHCNLFEIKTVPLPCSKFMLEPACYNECCPFHGSWNCSKLQPEPEEQDEVKKSLQKMNDHKGDNYQIEKAWIAFCNFRDITWAAYEELMAEESSNNDNREARRMYYAGCLQTFWADTQIAFEKMEPDFQDLADMLGFDD